MATNETERDRETERHRNTHFSHISSKAVPESRERKGPSRLPDKKKKKQIAGKKMERCTIKNHQYKVWRKIFVSLFLLFLFTLFLMKCSPVGLLTFARAVPGNIPDLLDRYGNSTLPLTNKTMTQSSLSFIFP